MSGYLDNSGREDVLNGGSRMIGIDTPRGPYRVWVKRTGNNPRTSGPKSCRMARSCGRRGRATGDQCHPQRDAELSRRRPRL